MKFDRKTVDTLISTEDEKLAGILTLLVSAKGNGVKPETARRIKEVLKRLTDGEIERIAELIDIYKKTGR